MADGSLTRCMTRCHRLLHSTLATSHSPLATSHFRNMSHLDISTAALSGPGAMPPPGQFEPRWYAVWTRSRHEKRVAEQLARTGLEHYLPLYETVRRWQDRRMRLELPLFPGYLFVRALLAHRRKVLEIPSVVCLVSFRGMPEPLPEGEVERLRDRLASGARVEPHRYLTVGRRVRIRNGPFEGLEGILLRKRNSLRVIVSIELIRRAIAVEVASTDVAPLG
jgi:transcription termination/antitermination protein NusG